MCDNHQDHDESVEESIIKNIEKHGCFLALFEADTYLPSFAYSIGLYEKYNHPEIICFGLDIQIMSKLINNARDLIKQGAVFHTNESYSNFLEKYSIEFIAVNKNFYPDYLGYANSFYRNSEYPVLQLVWTDKAHKYPWENGFDSSLKFRQPLLDRNTDFKFYEERNLGVYTTKQVLEGEPILYVYHDDDGDWQFFNSDEPDLKDSKLVSLEQLVKIDPSLNEIYFLQYGEKAWRKSKDDEWNYG